jgi:hypothetical protein
MTDRQLDEVRQRWWNQASPFFRQHAAGASPRTSRTLARQMFDFAKQNPVAAAPTAAPEQSAG